MDQRAHGHSQPWERRRACALLKEPDCPRLSVATGEEDACPEGSTHTAEFSSPTKKAVFCHTAEGTRIPVEKVWSNFWSEAGCILI